MHPNNINTYKHAAMGGAALCLLATLGGAGLPSLSLFFFFSFITGMFISNGSKQS
jgi:hypothetical protein